MKKILAFILCAMLMVALPVVASAEEAEPTEEVEVSSEVENEPSMTEKIVEYVKDNIEEIVVIAFMALGSFYEARVRGKMNGSIGLLNNNAIAVAENSATSMNNALIKVEALTSKVTSYEEKIEALLEAFGKNIEEKARLEDTLNHVETFLVSAKGATLELANELAELLVLSNIPNSKKEELYARHMKAVHDIENAEEAITNDGEET